MSFARPHECEGPARACRRKAARPGRFSALAGVVLAASSPALPSQAQSWSISKSPVAADISAGDSAVFLYEIQNSGPASLTGTVTDTLPAGVAWTTPGFCSYDAGTRALSCPIGTLTAGSTLDFLASGPTGSEDCAAPLSSTALATTNFGNASSQSEIRVHCPSLAFGVSIQSGVFAGDRAALRLVVTNNGAGIARSVSLLMQPSAPGGAAFAVEPPEPSCGTAGCAFGDIGPGRGRSVRVAVTTLPGLCGQIASGTVQLTSTNSSPSQLSASNPVKLVGDANGDCAVSVADVFFLISFLFAGGPAPS